MSYIKSNEFIDLINNKYKDDFNFIHKIIKWLNDNEIKYMISDKSLYNKFENEEIIIIIINNIEYKFVEEIFKDRNYIYSSNLKIMNFFTSKKNNIIDTNIANNIHNNEISIKDDINPEVISKIQDNFDTGFDPFNSDYDSESTISSISSKK